MTTDTYKETALGIPERKDNTHGRHMQGLGHDTPNMGTMLSFIATDAPSPPYAAKALREAVGVTFNRISVDGIHPQTTPV